MYCYYQYDVANGYSYLVMEYINITSGNKDSQYKLGVDLARMHKCYSPNNQHGFHIDNSCGNTPQFNSYKSNWCDFFVENRLLPQFRMLKEKNSAISEENKVIEKVKEILKDHHPKPSLLHGDLWGGNAGFIDHSIPVIFDPSTYYGDRETDLAMTEVFGGFSSEFYRGYDDEYPYDKSGYIVRKNIYALYHALNHMNLFGNGYRSMVNSYISNILSYKK